MNKKVEEGSQKEPDKFADIRAIPFGEELPTFTTPKDDTLLTLSFNEKTKFSDPTPARKILEMAKEPPLGIRQLHQMGLTGKGVNVAIIDQPLALDHPEYRERILSYKSFCDPSQVSSMHGPAVMSLLAGKTIGTAPESSVIFAAVPSWEGDAEYAARALDWILEENNKLPIDKKIKFVSVSAAFGWRKFKSAEKWTKSVQKAQKDGVCVVECTKENRFVSPMWVDPKTNEFKYGYPNEPQSEAGHEPYDLVFAPNSIRTVAESYDNKQFGFTYWGMGGLSWAIPYVVGLLALSQQANPNLSAEELKQLLIKTAKENKNIIAPKAFIDEVIKSKTTEPQQ